MFQHPVVRSMTAFAALLALAMVVFAPVMRLSFLSDDMDMVWGTGQGAGTWHHGFFRPISFQSFRLVHLIAGDGVLVHRLLNVGVHAVNAFLLFLLVSALLKERSYSERAWAAWMAAGLFIVYPFHQEAIVWIVGRYPALATMFMLSSLLVIVRVRPAYLCVPLSGVLFLFALLSYEIGICLPFLALPLVRRKGIGLRPWTVMSLVVLLIWIAWRFMANGQLTSEYTDSVVHHDAWTIVLSVPKALARLVLPPCDDTWRQALRIALVIIASALALRRLLPVLRKDEPLSSVVGALLWMLLISGWLAFVGGVSTRTSESDRFLYLPSVFLCGIIGTLVARIGKPSVRFAVVAAMFAACMTGLRTDHRNWMIASRITESTLNAVRSESAHGPMVVVDLPEEHEGAYIFRHGAGSMLLLNGLDTARIHIDRTVTRQEMIDDGTRDRIEDLYDRGLPIGRLVPDTSGNTWGRRLFQWTP